MKWTKLPLISAGKGIIKNEADTYCHRTQSACPIYSIWNGNGHCNYGRFYSISDIEGNFDHTLLDTPSSARTGKRFSDYRHVPAAFKRQVMAYTHHRIYWLGGYRHTQ